MLDPQQTGAITIHLAAFGHGQTVGEGEGLGLIVLSFCSV